MKTHNAVGIGGLSGVLLILIVAHVRLSSSALAHSVMADRSSGLVVASGGLLSSTNDLFWVLYKRAPSESERKLLGKNFEGERLTLCTYRIASGGGAKGQGHLVLISARDISFDLKTIGLDAETVKSVHDIRKAYEDALKKAEQGK